LNTDAQAMNIYLHEAEMVQVGLTPECKGVVLCEYSGRAEGNMEDHVEQKGGPGRVEGMTQQTRRDDSKTGVTPSTCLDDREAAAEGLLGHPEQNSVSTETR
ncbi:hypothetical protein STEG23_036295, partial [Scotinomys teguina]